jgi:nitrogen fixation NifU-like protein
MFNERLLDHFRNPRNVGELEAPAVTVEVGNPACGDILRLSARFEGDRVAAVRYQVRGCTASIAAGSAMSERIAGESRAGLARIGTDEIEELVGGLPAESRHAAALCVDGIRALLKTAAFTARSI